MKDLIELLKKKNKTVIWAIGIIVFWFIWPSYEHEPKFVKENELVTWDMAERAFFVILGIIWIQKLTSSYLFRDEKQEEWSKAVDQRIDSIEKKVDLLANWAIKTDEEKTSDRL